MTRLSSIRKHGRTARETRAVTFAVLGLSVSLTTSGL
jgi:hypothetical protein